MFHLVGCLRSVSNSWWSACSSSSPPAYFLPSQKTCHPWPNALGGFPQPLKSSPFLVSTTVLATREGLAKVKMLSRNNLPVIIPNNKNNSNIDLDRCGKQHFLSPYRPFHWFLQPNPGPYRLYGGLSHVAGSRKFKQVWQQKYIFNIKYLLKPSLIVYAILPFFKGCFNKQWCKSKIHVWNIIKINYN